MSSGPRTVRAAGALPYRLQAGALQVALVHRPRYDDWSWPKGKLDPGEDWSTAAARETREETGLRVRLGMPLPEATYPLRDGSTKVVRYWAGHVLGGDGELEHEVDEVVWLSPTLAARRFSYERDRSQLEALVALHTSGRLDTWPLLLVRHARALARGNWDGPDPQRPLVEVGRRRAERMVQVLQAYAPLRVLSSPSVRCVDTVLPFTAATGVPLTTKKGLSEEGFAEDPAKSRKHLEKVLAVGEPIAVCTQGPVLPGLLQTLAARADPEPGRRPRGMLARLAEVLLDKGEVLACTMTGRGEDARVVAVERHRPPS
ncbi:MULTISPECIES: NUDIX domain-containing protein [unclassified Ornithinimicrobium]|uniref:NUDIX hydrolase n=1 Tax=unclassified Ornithinimicrobium TaxID=2615080 RepID=UPI003851E8EA